MKAAKNLLSFMAKINVWSVKNGMQKTLGAAAFLGSLIAMGIFSINLRSATVLTVPRPDLEETTRKIADEILNHGEAFNTLRDFISAGPRLCGSAGASHAVEWAEAKLKSYGLDRVWRQPLRVPVWTRGAVESASVASGSSEVSLQVRALGQSAGTTREGLTAEVVEVQSLDEANRLGSSLRGKIVFYNRSMDASLEDRFEAYGRAVDQRSAGPALAARNGAVGALVRTLTTLPDDPHPHTGITHFRNGTTAIPAAAISTHDANVLSRLLKQSPSLKLHLTLSASRASDTTSFNVIGELRGSELPQEIVVAGGHLDSWDLSPGAHDDGAGVAHSLEVLRVFKKLGLRPRRTVRTVLFMCEETGGLGGQEYARQAKELGEHHLAATESDRGGFRPRGFSIDDKTGRTLARTREWNRYLAVTGATASLEGESGTDVAPLSPLGASTIDLVGDSQHYFDFHHSEVDQLSAVNPRELHQGAAALSILTYLLAEQGL